MIATDSELNPLPSILEPNYVPVAVDLTGGLVEGPGGAISKAGDNKSANYDAGKQGWIIRSNGDVEFNAGIFRGSLAANTINIPGPLVTTAGWHVDSSGNMWWGTSGAIGTATIYIKANGDAKFTSLTLSGYIPTGGALSDTQSSIGAGGLSAITANIGSITSGSITGVTITGGTLQTATSGQRIVITQAANDIKFYSADNTLQGEMYGDNSLGLVIDPSSSGVLFIRNGGLYSEGTIICETDIIANLNGSGTGSSGGFLMDGVVVIDYNRAARNMTYVGLPRNGSTDDIGASGSEWQYLHIKQVFGNSGANTIDFSKTGYIATNQQFVLKNNNGTGSLPTQTGSLFYDTGTSKLRFYDGGTWRTVTST